MALHSNKKTKKKGTTKRVRCANHNPAESRWGSAAPVGGCQEWLEIDQHSLAGVCWKCTNRLANGVKN